MNKASPVAVLISDIHYNLNTLAVADAALRQAVEHANTLNVPLIIAGDLNDSKANLRAECVNTLIETLDQGLTPRFILRGNHDALNEKSSENSVYFLNKLSSEDNECISVINRPCFINELGAINGNSIWLIPYNHDPASLREQLKKVDKDSVIIMHQGVEGSHSGDYIQDKSALTQEDFKDFRVISGHYHRRQDIKCGRPKKGAVGLFSYIGNPYTLNFGEAEDPEKGFQVLMDDGTLTFVPTNLRKHLVIKAHIGAFWFLTIENSYDYKPGDIVKVVLSGQSDHLAVVEKTDLAERLGIGPNFRLDLEPTDTGSEVDAQLEKVDKFELFNSLIDTLPNTDHTRKTRLKSIWKDFIS